MKIISTNIAKPKYITINGKRQKTGIFKIPTNQPIYLEKEQVKGDEISNRKVHGGEFKACYLFSADYYSYWKKLYPQLDWHYGMLGENLTVKGFDETKVYIGDVYKVGNALVQITQPREPCTTFAAKMGSQDILKQFIAHGRPGTYVKIIQEGTVTIDDTINLVEKAKNSITIAQFFKLLFSKNKDQEHLYLILQNEAIPIQKRQKLKRFIK